MWNDKYGSRFLQCKCQETAGQLRISVRKPEPGREDTPTYGVCCARCWRRRFQRTKVYHNSNNKNGQLASAARLCFQLVGLFPFVNLPVVAEVQTSHQRAPAANTCRAPAARCSQNIACEIWSQTFPGDRNWTTQAGKIKPRGFQPLKRLMHRENVPERSRAYCRFCFWECQPVWLFLAPRPVRTQIILSPSGAITHNATTQKRELSITKFNMFSDP